LDEAGANLDVDWTKYVEIDPQFYRPVEVDYLLADASMALQVLGWKPKVRFKELVQIMCNAEMNSD
jgi:GDPmannose 4,6-dehydratase